MVGTRKKGGEIDRGRMVVEHDQARPFVRYLSAFEITERFLRILYPERLDVLLEPARNRPIGGAFNEVGRYKPTERQYRTMTMLSTGLLRFC